MKSVSKKLLSIYRELYETYGPQHWWPADSPFEVLIGAILTQNTAWGNVEKAIANLKSKSLLHEEGMGAIAETDLADLIRSSGYFRQKAKKLKLFISFLKSKGGIEDLSEWKTTHLRKSLLELHGIGPETADSMLLYSFHRPIFVIDAYTQRIFTRLGIVPHKPDYQGWQDLFMQHLPLSETLFNEYHALIVKHAKESCVKKAPFCLTCPVQRACDFNGKVILRDLSS